MRISVIMPVYNGEKYLREAIDSILNQTFNDFEFIIINDASTDKTEELIKSYHDERILYIKNPKNIGVARTLNKGLNIAKGEYIARMDADDVSMPNRFAEQIKYLDSHRNCGICGCQIIKICDYANNEKIEIACKDKYIKVNLIYSSAFAHPTVMMRSEVLRKFNLLYDPEYEKMEDYELWVRMSDITNMHNLNKALLKYRIHNNQVTEQKLEPEKIMLLRKRILERIFGELDDKCIELFYKRDGFSESEYNQYLALIDKFYIENKKKNIYNKFALKKTFSLLKINIAINNNYDIRYRNLMDILVMGKIRLLQSFHRHLT